MAWLLSAPGGVVRTITRDNALAWSAQAKGGTKLRPLTFAAALSARGEKFAVCREGASHGRACFEKHKQACYDNSPIASDAPMRRSTCKRARIARVSSVASPSDSDDDDGVE